jgi:galactose mutarotase-like enzyme
MTEPSDLIEIRSDRLSATINPLGSELHSLRDAAGRDLLWNGDPAYWTGRAPVLFPIVGMLAKGRYRIGEAVYILGKHGFARRKRFEARALSSNAALFRLEPDAETLSVYPFQFSLEIRFTIEDNALTLCATLANTGDRMLPASLGFHPALRWPLPFGAVRADHRILFDQEEPAPIRRIDGDGLLKPQSFPTPVQGRSLLIRDDLFLDDAVIFDKLNSRKLLYGCDACGPWIEVAFPDTPYLGVWTKPGAGFICIEPWHGHADPEGYDGDFYEKPGSMILEPSAEKTISMSIRLLDAEG